MLYNYNDPNEAADAMALTFHTLYGILTTAEDRPRYVSVDHARIAVMTAAHACFPPEAVAYADGESFKELPTEDVFVDTQILVRVAQLAARILLGTEVAH